MIYLVKADLITYCQERFIDESMQGDESILDEIELAQIGVLKSYLGTRYDVSAIFDTESPIRNSVLKRILARMVLYWLIKRNAARKVPTNFQDDFDAANKELMAIATGKTTLSDLPTITDDNGNPVSNTLWGNNSNSDFYI